MFKRTFDFTNETASHPPAQKSASSAVQHLLVVTFLYKKYRAARQRKIAQYKIIYMFQKKLKHRALCYWEESSCANVPFTIFYKIKL
jgi:hypothetical protein